jgi:NAD(P)-dependent dehydrogenase (short-subunit alcohol dehydrogenase family)
MNHPPRTSLVTGATDGLGRGVSRWRWLSAVTRCWCTAVTKGASRARSKSCSTRHRGQSCAATAPTSRSSRRYASAQQIATGETRLDVLINNAGIGTNVPGGPLRQESRDGHELRFAVNYLAPFLLTRLLLPLIERSAPARIINVSSLGQQAIDFDDPMLEHAYGGVRAYCQSKLAQILFTLDLASRWRRATSA